MEEVDGPAALGFDNLRGFMSRAGLSDEQLEAIDEMRDTFAKHSYILKHGVENPTYNWPYDYFSLLELGKIDTKVGFRPDLTKEYSKVIEAQEGLERIQLNISPNSAAGLASGEPLSLTLFGSANNNEET